MAKFMRRYRIYKVIIIFVTFTAIIFAGYNSLSDIHSKDVKKEEYYTTTNVIEEIPIKLYKEDERCSEEISYEQINTLFGMSDIEPDFKSDEQFSIAIVDSGIYPHEYLKDKIIASIDFVANKELPYDDLGHGTSVSGIISALSDANLISLKVITSTDKVEVENLIEALEWIDENQQEYNIKVVNISIGVTINEKSQEIHRLCHCLAKKGVILIASSGNKNGLSERFLPADCKDVISVGSIGVDGEKYISSFSMSWIGENGYSVPSIYAYGENIETLDSNNLYKGNEGEIITLVNSKHFESGTSFSAAVVSGLVCRFIQKYPLLSSEEIKKELLNGENIFDSVILKEIPMTVYSRRDINEKHKNC